ncbi:UNVERIFIED_CONTAM: hypothetical protein RMT77_009917 [Armadillidium vulgare]
MKEINNAFESLRKALPDACETRITNTMTKISTLKLAVQYIQALSRVLDDASDNHHYYSLETSSPVSSKIKSHYGQNVDAGTEETESGVQSCFLQSSNSLSNSSSLSRSSLSSASDLEEFLSDDSALLEDNLDVFNDIQPLPGPDPFELLMEQSRENLFASDFCTFK